jgi:hypothetical protein
MEKKTRVKHYSTVDIGKMTAYQKWRIFLGVIQIITTLGIPWVTIIVYRALDYGCK